MREEMTFYKPLLDNTTFDNISIDNNCVTNNILLQKFDMLL
jgi:hypothetical protein